MGVMERNYWFIWGQGKTQWKLLGYMGRMQNRMEATGLSGNNGNTETAIWGFGFRALRLLICTCPAYIYRGYSSVKGDGVRGHKLT